MGQIRPGRVIRVGIAEDHPLAREGLVQLFESADDIVIVGEAADGDEALERGMPRPSNDGLGPSSLD